MEKIAIGADHAGFKLKEFVKNLLLQKGYEVIDVGTHSEERCHYPEYAKKVAQMVSRGEVKRGILVCGSGIGMSMAANKHHGIRAALCHYAYTATVARGHNDANILCFGERIVGTGVAESIIDAWCAGSFDGGRHCGRVEKIEL